MLSCWGSYFWGLWWQFRSSTAQDLYGLASLSFSVQSWAHVWGEQFIMKRPHEAGWSCEGGHLCCFRGVPRLLTLASVFIWTSFWYLGPLNRRLCPRFSYYYGVRETSDPLHVMGTLWCLASLLLCPGLHAVTSWWMCECSILLGCDGGNWAVYRQ